MQQKLIDPKKVIDPIDQELDRLETEIRRLKVEYDIFFNGGMMRPPLDTKGRVETAIKRLYDARGMAFGQRFRYNSLVARYNVMRELWRRQTGEREESGRPPTVEAHMGLRERTAIIQCRDPKHEADAVRDLYNRLITARRECGERVEGLTLNAFSQFLISRVDDIKHRLGAEAVDFEVGVDRGKVKFTARASIKDEG